MLSPGKMRSISGGLAYTGASAKRTHAAMPTESTPAMQKSCLPIGFGRQRLLDDAIMDQHIARHGGRRGDYKCHDQEDDE